MTDTCSSDVEACSTGSAAATAAFSVAKVLFEGPGLTAKVLEGPGEADLQRLALQLLTAKVLEGPGEADLQRLALQLLALVF
jgi:hypothetical protein